MHMNLDHHKHQFNYIFNLPYTTSGNLTATKVGKQTKNMEYQGILNKRNLFFVFFKTNMQKIKIRHFI